MNIMLTVSYCIDIPKEDFFYVESGEVKEEIMERLETLFPKEIALTKEVAAQREHLIHYPLMEGKNSLRCASCGRWLYMPEREYLPVCLEYCQMVEGIPLCSSCVWELEADMKNEAFVQKLREQMPKYDDT